MCSSTIMTRKLLVQRCHIPFISEYKHNFNDNFRKFCNANIININNKLTMPECPRPSFMESLMMLMSHDKAMNLHEIVNQKHKKYGPIFKDHIGPITAIFVNSPKEYRRIFKLEGDKPKHLIPEAWLLYNDMNKSPRGLLFMDGDEWLHFRKIMNRLLLVPNLAKSVIDDSCREVAVSWTKKLQDNVNDDYIIRDLETQMYQWSLEVILATLVGSNWKVYKNISSNQENIEKLARKLHQIFELSAKLSLLPVKIIKKLKLPLWCEFVRVFDDAFEIIRILIMGMKILEGDGLVRLMTNEGIKKKDVVRIATDLILAAGDTTSFSTLWALFLLGTHPNVQNTVAEKITSVDSSKILNNPYIKGIMKESLRLYPTAPFITRMLPEDSIIGHYPVSKGELIIMSLYSSGRDEKNFLEPNKFLPDRWIKNESGRYDKITEAAGSIPFAMGVRSCVGKKLAETQITLTLTEIIKNFRIECINSDKIKMKLHLITVPSEPIKLRLKPRNKI